MSASPRPPTSDRLRPREPRPETIASGALTTWGPERLDDLVALATAAMPDERLSADELESCCFHDGGVVLGTTDGLAAIAAVRRAAPGRTLDDPGPGFVRFVAVDPRLQRAGVGRALVTAAHEWLVAHGADSIHPGGEAPYYLWPGVDVRALPALCLFEAAGYAPVGAAVNLAIGVPLAPGPPASAATTIAVTRVLDDADAAAVLAFSRAHAARSEAEVHRAVEHGSCFVARSDGDPAVVGFACHSVNRAGWIGPVFTDPARRGRGVGRSLLVAASRDLSTADLRSAEIAWVDTVGFYARAADAWVARVFRTLRFVPG